MMENKQKQNKQPTEPKEIEPKIVQEELALPINEPGSESISLELPSGFKLSLTSAHAHINDLASLSAELFAHFLQTKPKINERMIG